MNLCTFCNLKCKHCYNESSSQCHEIMSLDDFKMVCQELIDIGVRKVQLIGGEPFVIRILCECLTMPLVDLILWKCLQMELL